MIIFRKTSKGSLESRGDAYQSGMKTDTLYIHYIHNIVTPEFAQHIMFPLFICSLQHSGKAFTTSDT
jgi:hypothetical protein